MSNQKPYIVALNGPPRSGKDSIGKALQEIVTRRCNISVFREALSFPLRQIVFCMMGRPYDESFFEEEKDVVQPILGMTIREAQIAVMERVLRPGNPAYLPESLMQKHGIWWGSVPALIIITDLGFPIEVETLAPESWFMPVRVHREGYDWANDSRSYVETVGYATIDNNQTPEIAAEALYEGLLNMGWNLQIHD